VNIAASAQALITLGSPVVWTSWKFRLFDSPCAASLSKDNESDASLHFTLFPSRHNTRTELPRHHDLVDVITRWQVRSSNHSHASALSAVTRRNRKTPPAPKFEPTSASPEYLYTAKPSTWRVAPLSPRHCPSAQADRALQGPLLLLPQSLRNARHHYQRLSQQPTYPSLFRRIAAVRQLQVRVPKIKPIPATPQPHPHTSHPELVAPILNVNAYRFSTHSTKSTDCDRTASKTKKQSGPYTYASRTFIRERRSVGVCRPSGLRNPNILTIFQRLLSTSWREPAII
jgi:hypothetical protein